MTKYFKIIVKVLFTSLLPDHCVLNKIDCCPTNGIQVICTRRQDVMPFEKQIFRGHVQGGLTLSNILFRYCFLVSYRLYMFWGGASNNIGLLPLPPPPPHVTKTKSFLMMNDMCTNFTPHRVRFLHHWLSRGYQCCIRSEENTHIPKK